MPRRAVAALALAMAVLLVIMVQACGGTSTNLASRTSSSSVRSSSASTTTLSTTSPTPRHLNNDGDNDEDDNGNGIRLYGHAASPADSRTLTALVKRYYAAAAADDGAKACRLLNPAIASSAAEDYSRMPGPPYLHGAKTCGAVLSRLFKHNHSQLAGGVAAIHIIGLRVSGNHGYALLLFNTVVDERQIALERKNGTWKVNVLIDSELP